MFDSYIEKNQKKIAREMRRTDPVTKAFNSFVGPFAAGALVVGVVVGVVAFGAAWGLFVLAKHIF